MIMLLQHYLQRYSAILSIFTTSEHFFLAMNALIAGQTAGAVVQPGTMEMSLALVSK